MIDPLIGHLSDLCRAAPDDSFILGGGLALRLRRDMLLRTNARTLAGASDHELPEARVTFDIDAFVRLEVFERGDRRVREAIDALGYRELTPKWQFAKPLRPGADTSDLVLDLMSALPPEGGAVAVNGIRVGAGSRADLHGRRVAEAFAVERLPARIAVEANGGESVWTLIAHPFAMLCMKVQASHDWLRYRSDPGLTRPNQKSPSEKHTFDAALCVAMLTETEQQECAELAREHAGHRVFGDIRLEARTLFGSADAPGWRSAVGQGMFEDHSLLWEAMGTCLAIG